MEKIKKLESRLQKCGFETEFFQSADIAKNKLFELIKNASVGYGGIR